MSIVQSCGSTAADSSSVSMPLVRQRCPRNTNRLHRLPPAGEAPGLGPSARTEDSIYVENQMILARAQDSTSRTARLVCSSITSHESKVRRVTAFLTAD